MIWRKRSRLATISATRPFGHTGEDALDACMAEHGGFDHNSHALRIVTELERHYAEFDGLNLTQPTLAGLIKHNGPLLDA